ncbi:MAG TPA: hypothetical protein VM784_07750 [Actinomycetota bacterium]|nr:hypothetical protein [Actinomycetota bacterium]
MNPRMRAWIPWTIAVPAIMLALSGVALSILNGNGLDGDASGAATLALSFSIAGAIVAWRRPGNIIGWLLLVQGISGCLDAFTFEYADYAYFTAPGTVPLASLVSWVSSFAFAPGAAMFPLLLLLFPTGQLPSPRWRWLPLTVAFAIALIAVPQAWSAWPLRGAELAGGETGFEGASAWARVGLIALGICFVSSLVALALRFRRAQGDERQQLKWVVFGGAFTLFAHATASPATPLDLGGPLGELLSVVAFFALPSIPAAIGIAILKYRLYDIDVIVNRTLVYAALTAVLVAAYAAGVLLFRTILDPVTGDNDVAIAASTLAVAALFGPARRRIQAFIDHRFYRSRYDAQQTLETFATRLRDELDLDALASEVLTVIGSTMQPAHAGLWLPHGPKGSR